MSVFKTTFSRALRAYPSDYADIPFINKITSGVSDAFPSNLKLVDNSAEFIKDNVKAGDIVYNETVGASATIVEVSSDVQLILNADIFTNPSELYTIYQASEQTGLPNQGCYLYFGDSSGGKARVTTIGGDIITFYGILQGEVLPVQVTKLWMEDTSDVNKIIALW